MVQGALAYVCGGEKLPSVAENSQANFGGNKELENRVSDCFKIQALAWSFYNQKARNEVQVALEEAAEGGIGAIEEAEDRAEKVLQKVEQVAQKVRKACRANKAQTKIARQKVIYFDAYCFLSKRAEILSTLKDLKKLEGNVLESDTRETPKGEIEDLQEAKMMAVAWLVYQSACEKEQDQESRSIRALQLLMTQLIEAEASAKAKMAKKEVEELEIAVEKFLNAVQEEVQEIVKVVIEEGKVQKIKKREETLAAAANFEEEKARIRCNFKLFKEELKKRDHAYFLLQANKAVEEAVNAEEQVWILKEEAQVATAKAINKGRAFVKIAVDMGLIKLAKKATKSTLMVLKAQIDQMEEVIKAAVFVCIKKANLLKEAVEESVESRSLLDQAAQVGKMSEIAEEVIIKAAEAEREAQVQREIAQRAIRLAIDVTREHFQGNFEERVKELEVVFEQEEVKKAQEDFRSKFQRQAQARVAAKLAYLDKEAAANEQVGFKEAAIQAATAIYDQAVDRAKNADRAVRESADNLAIKKIEAKASRERVLHRAPTSL